MSEDAAARAVLRRFGTFAEAFGDCFGRQAQRTAASQYVEGLFNDSERKLSPTLKKRRNVDGWSTAETAALTRILVASSA